MSIERAWEQPHTPETSQAELYVQPSLYGLAKYAPKKSAKKPPAEKVVARTTDGLQPFDLVNGWSTWMTEQTGVHPHKTMLARLMAEVKELILTGYSSSDIKWSLAIWSTKLASDLNTSPRALGDIAWKYRMDTSQKAGQWRRQMMESARTMGQNRISPSALAGTPADGKANATRTAAQDWAERQKSKEKRA